MSALETVSARSLTAGLAIYVLVVSLGLNGLIRLVSPEPYRQTVLDHSWDTLRGRSGDDSWGAMYVALEHVRAKPDVPLYQEIFFNQNYRFQYPPSSLFVLSAMLLAGQERVRLNDAHAGPWPTVNDLMGWICLAVLAGASALILEYRLEGRIAHDTPLLKALRAALVACLTLSFYPAVKAYTLGQIQIVITALMAAALLGWLWGWHRTSGVLVGLTALIKPHYGVLLLWASLHRVWGFVLACAATLAVGLAASVAVYGLANHLDYANVLSFLSKHGEAYFPNQSVNGILNRLAGITQPELYVNLDLPAGKFPPFTPWIYGATLLSSLGLLVVGLWPRGHNDQSGKARDFAVMVLCATMASPIAWEHHYAVTLPLLAMVLPAAVHRWSRLAVLMLAHVLIASFVPATNLLAASWGNLCQSLLFFGALALLYLLWTDERDASGVVRD